MVECIADEESVAHALIASLFCGCGFLWNANLETAAELVPNMSGLILGFSFSGVLSRIDARRQLIVDQANEGNTGNSRDFWSKSDGQRFGTP